MALLKYWDDTKSKWLPCATVGGSSGGTTPSGTASFKTEIVPALPTSNISSSTIYLVASIDASGKDNYDEYIYTNSGWERLGTRTSTDEVVLENIATTSEIRGIV